MSCNILNFFYTVELTSNKETFDVSAAPPPTSPSSKKSEEIIGKGQENRILSLHFHPPPPQSPLACFMCMYMTQYKQTKVNKRNDSNELIFQVLYIKIRMKRGKEKSHRYCL